MAVLVYLFVVRMLAVSVTVSSILKELPLMKTFEPTEL